MKVVYVSKALAVATYRDKIAEIAEKVAVTAVIPEYWSGAEPEPSPRGVPEPERVRVRFDGSNHLHHYPGAGAWLDRLGPDLVHVDEEPYSLVSLQLGRLCRRRGIPFVFFAWQNLDRRLPPPFGGVRAAVFRGAHGAMAGTGAAAGVLRSAGFDGPVSVIPQFGVDPLRFAPDLETRARTRSALGLEPDTFVVGYGGRLIPEKGVHVLLEAFRGLPEKTVRTAPRPRLVIIGDGPERPRLEAAARDAGLASRVHFLGHVPSLRIPETILACDVIALPSLGTRTWTEQFGRILVEAMACAIPVVASHCGAVPDVVGATGELVPPGDAPALAAAIERLRSDPALRQHRAAAGRARATAEFSQARVAEDTVAFYHQILEVGERRA